MRNKATLATVYGLCMLVLAAILVFSTACTSSAPPQSVAPAAAPTATAVPKTLELSLAIYQPTTHYIYDVFSRTLPQIESHTNGRVRVKLYAAETLAKGAEMWDAIQRGVADIAYPYLPYQATTMPLLDMGSLPVWRDFKGVHDAFDKGGLYPLLEQIYQKQGLTDVMPVMEACTGGRWLGNTKKVVKVPSDLKGLKIRATGAVEPKMMTLGGGTAVNISAPETYEAMERGIVDGAFGTATNWAVPYKWMEPAKYYTQIPSSATMTLIMKKSSYEKIPADLRTEVLDLLKQTIWIQRYTHMSEEQYFTAVAMPANMELYMPTDAEKAIWEKEVFQPVINDWLAKTGDVGAQALKIIKEYNK